MLARKRGELTQGPHCKLHSPQRNLACWNHAEVEMGHRFLRKPSSGEWSTVNSSGNGVVTS